MEQETLETKTTYSKNEIKIENLEIETIEVPEYNYGQSQNTLDYNKAIRNKPEQSGWKYKVWSFDITSAWYLTISWVWFRPKYLEIEWIYGWWYTKWKTDWTTTNSIILDTIINTNTRYTSEIIRMRNNWTTILVTNFDSFTDDWFIINTTYYSASVNCTYTAIW